MFVVVSQVLFLCSSTNAPPRIQGLGSWSLLHSHTHVQLCGLARKWLQPCSAPASTSHQKPRVRSARSVPPPGCWRDWGVAGGGGLGRTMLGRNMEGTGSTACADSTAAPVPATPWDPTGLLTLRGRAPAAQLPLLRAAATTVASCTDSRHADDACARPMRPGASCRTGEGNRPTAAGMLAAPASPGTLMARGGAGGSRSVVPLGRRCSRIVAPSGMTTPETAPGIMLAPARKPPCCARGGMPGSERLIVAAALLDGGGASGCLCSCLCRCAKPSDEDSARGGVSGAPPPDVRCSGCCWRPLTTGVRATAGGASSGADTTGNSCCATAPEW
eukprot:366449-Chlamydomonas_euryale.AAC.17